MPYYENVYIARQDLTDAQVKTMTEHFEKIITDAKGKIHKTEFWGLKSFAYKINKARKGHYILIEMETEAEALHEMERQMRLNEDVVRFLTTRQEELSDGPSVMMDKGGRDDDRKPRRDDDRKPRDNKDKKEAA